ncbi:MAG: NADH-quinone oxidoreductase subunit NuoF [Candidatus Hydrogenedentota bacterium]|nr:MAG: NADH-quinone oxidoreductase subunit NuoF [Candidatus Hydrogenedentota bacterium]
MKTTVYLSERFELGRTARLADYGEYRGLKRAREMAPAEVVALVKTAVVEGRGGAGFPAGMKWEFATKAPRPRYLVCNADESEPGTFKDVQIMERDPHRLIEGMAIAAHALEAERAYIYIRGEFVRAWRILEEAIAEAKELIAPLEIFVHPGAGAYICGEETALLESLEGKIGQPRLKPPFPVTHGVFGRPTVVNNVETLSCISLILERGVEWWHSLGTENAHGTKLFCVSGDVVNPGVVEAPMGVTLREIIEEFAGGCRPGRSLQAVFPGGSSAPPLAPDEIDVPMDFKSVAKLDSMFGSAGIIVVDDSRCMVDVAENVIHFYAHESCGKCTPCRDGTTTVEEALKAILDGRGSEEDLRYFEEMPKRIFADCFCPLAKGSMWSFGAIFRKWRDDFEAHVRGGGCGRERM